MGTLAAPSAVAQVSGFQVSEKATLELAADRTSYEPGSSAWIAARVRIEDRWHVNSHQPSYEWLIPTELELEAPPGVAVERFDYPPHEMKSFAFTEEPIAVYEGTVRILAELELAPDLPQGPLELEAVLRYQACDDKQCLPPVTTRAPLTLAIGSGGEAANAAWFAPREAPGEAPAAPPAVAEAAGGASPGLLAMLALALLGGLILNAMPCVLPVLSLKLFGLMKSAGEGRSALVAGTLATTAGILASFWALALAAILAARAGAAVGWGVQFQQPGFVAFLAVVVVLFALNMWGLFEIPLPAALARVGGGAGREGLAGHFASGLFATLMATPCSAPFLGTAVGFALAQPPAVIFAVFTAVGLGLALPYLLIAAVPAAVRLLPKPGAWMVTLRQLMGFFLAAAAVWLFYVLAAQIDAAWLAAVQLALLFMALGGWLYGKAAGRSGRVAAGATMALATMVAIALAAGAPRAATGGTESGGRIAWTEFDESQALALVAEGRPVFVDVTADWCLTCKANERLVLETDEVAAAFERHGVVPMKADWTNRDDAITRYLASFGRSAIPFYVLYPPGGEPRAFSELLSKRRLLAALEETRATTASAAGSR